MKWKKERQKNDPERKLKKETKNELNILYLRLIESF